MRSEFILELSKKLNERNLFPIGCLQKEMEQLENYAHFPLPKTYKEFMAFMGRGAGDYLADMNITYKKVFENKNSMNELLEEDTSDFKLSETDFVFSSYQGEQFMYFNLREGDNPPVYYYIEGTSKVPRKIYDSFTEYILDLF